jgi:Siphovirus ReqiPepy6 Gp37-like protein
LLILGEIGIRNIRPNNTTGSIISFDTSRTASRGNVITTPTSNISQIRLDVYNGTDRSRLQSSREPVIFHYDAGHIDNPSYLFSTTEYKTMATVSSSIGNVNVYPPSVRQRNAEATGYNRRVLFVDGGDIGDQDYNTFVNSLVQKALVELKKHSKVRLFDGAISPVSPYEFRKDYFLGDYVTLLARWGFDQTMKVSEYVRTEDAEGDRGYPGLSSLAD